MDFHLAQRGEHQLTATIVLAADRDPPKELQVTFRAPAGKSIRGVTANGKPVVVGGRWKDSAIVPVAGTRKFEVIAELS